jgi:Arc/MetJ-type ribon-helix-helix transcriptional regulator
MARAIHVRLDERSEASLDVLRATGLSDSEAVRRALDEAGARQRTRAALADEARALASDPVDRTEAATVRAAMDDLVPDA